MRQLVEMAGGNARRARRRLQRRPAAVARRHPLDSHRPRHVPRGESFGGQRRHRHHHRGRRRRRSAAASRRACATACSAAAIRSSTSRRRSARRTSTSTLAARSCRTRARSRCSWAAASSSTRRSRPSRPRRASNRQLLGRRPNDGWNLNGMLDYALTKEQMLRVGYSQNCVVAQQPRHRRLRSGRARVLQRDRATTSCACRRPDRSAGTRSSTRACSCDSIAIDVHLATRGADHSRAGRLYERRRAGQGRRAIRRTSS